MEEGVREGGWGDTMANSKSHLNVLLLKYHHYCYHHHHNNHYHHKPVCPFTTTKCITNTMIDNCIAQCEKALKE